jgi:outer membrane biosynthesis protein TonB
MRTAQQTFVAIVIAASFGRACAQAGKTERSQGDSGAACIERLQIPDYPPLAIQAAISGTLTTSVVLSPQATVQSINTDAKMARGAGAPILVVPVENAVRQATFRPNCGGQTVVMIFHFEFGKTLSYKPKQSVMFGYPNTLWIVSEKHQAIAD